MIATKRWDHLTVSSPAVTLAANFSAIAGRDETDHRLSVLVFSDRVAGNITTYPASSCHVSPWRSSVRFDRSYLRELDGSSDPVKAGFTGM